MCIRNESVIANTLTIKCKLCPHNLWRRDRKMVIYEGPCRSDVCVCVANASKITMTWQLPFHISFVRSESMAAIIQSDFCQTLVVKCRELWCHCWHECSWCVNMKLAKMATWKQFCETHISNLWSKSAVCRPPWTSLLSNRENGLHCFQGVMTYIKQGLFVFFWIPSRVSVLVHQTAEPQQNL